MEVAIPGSSNGGSPFQREVREWQRIDPNTGALLTGRMEADRWINGPLNTYGKVVDSQNVSQPNGTQHTQRKQLEVLQARTSSGAMQVIRSQTVQKTSSRWSSSTSTTTRSSKGHYNMPAIMASEHFDDSTSNDEHDDMLRAQNRSHILNTAPSLKLRNLMKSSSNVTSAGNKISLHTLSNSMSLAQAQAQARQPNNPNNVVRHDTACDDTTTAISPSSSAATLPSTASSSSSSSTTVTTTATIPQSASTQNGGGSRAYEFSSPTDFGISVGGCGISDDDDVGIGIGNGGGGFGRLLSERQQPSQMESSHCRNERETLTSDIDSDSHGSQFLRGRSASTDDLTTDWDQNDDDDAPTEWRRVSKIRRSFQFPKNSTTTTTTAAAAMTAQLRPLDLPANSVSVAKIRNELENGRRLNTVMRNNQLDLAALDHILKGVSSNTPARESNKMPKLPKRTSFLTAESLKEIRGKLKKLSDESLYKDDFVTQDDLDKECEETMAAVVAVKEMAIVPRGAPEFKFIPKAQQQQQQRTTNSLETRTNKTKDTNSSEWHLRRKSYGFEKMSPPDDKKMFRLESSTDSGIGRSGELGNWSPTESSPQRGTIITFGEPATITTVALQTPAVKDGTFTRQRRTLGANQSDDNFEMKRHSIAVDESKYVRKTSINLNGFSDDYSRKSSSHHKRVEFCKTEVHFAAESGRVNIVETDGKPPSTNNFRRRRRNSGIGNGYLEAVNAGRQVIHFGDEKKTSAEEDFVTNNVTVSVPLVVAEERTQDDTDADEEVSLRGILKNKPVKPKPYHLGENIDSADSLFGVKLKPIAFGGSSERKDVLPEALEQTPELLQITSKSTSVADRIKIVEERKDGVGYSTKINLSLSDSPYGWNNPDHNTHLEPINRPIKLHLTSHKTQPSRQLAHNELKSTSLIIKTMRSTGNLFENTTTSTVTKSNPSKPLPAPRIKVLGSSNAISHQLSQLRRMYEAAGHESDESNQADEEVKKYFGGDLSETESSLTSESAAHEGKASEWSGSWSRMKARRTFLKIQSEKEIQELPKSNVMSIALHSPPSTLKKNPQAIKLPVAKPRTTIRQNLDSQNATEKKPPLNIHKDVRGARQLREHELSYFGVKMANQAESMPVTRKTSVAQLIPTTNPTNRRLTPPENEKWTHMDNDKPDLLRHSPTAQQPAIVVQALVATRQDVKTADVIQESGPLYENLKKSKVYDRKKDLNRDERNLSEMNASADQAMKAVSDDHNRKDELRRLSIPRTSKPLATIVEKKSSTLTRRTQPTATARVSRKPNRTSSISSTDSTHEYVNLKPKPKTRSTSRDSQKTLNSSTEDVRKPRIARQIATNSHDRKKHSTVRSTNDLQDSVDRRSKTGTQRSSKSTSERMTTSAKKSSKTDKAEQPMRVKATGTSSTERRSKVKTATVSSGHHQHSTSTTGSNGDTLTQSKKSSTPVKRRLISRFSK